MVRFRLPSSKSGVGSQQCASTVSLSRSFRAEVFRRHPGRKEGIQAVPVQDHRKNRMKQSARKK